MLCIKPMNLLFALGEEGWQSTEFFNLMAELNPFQNPRIKRMLFLRYNLARSIAMYDEQMFEFYWKYQSDDAKAEAKAYFNYYTNAYETLTAFQHHYEKTFYTSQPYKYERLESYILSQHPEAPDETDTTGLSYRAVRTNNYYQLTPPRSKLAIEYNRVIQNRNSDLSDLSRIVAGKSKGHEIWREYQGWTQDAIHASELIWWQYMLKASNTNALRKSASGGILIENDNIPKPTLATFLAWFNICGFQITKVHRNRFGIEAIITAAIPHLPATRDHSTHGSPSASLITDSDSSLPYRNSAHNKDKYNNIEYGQWIVSSATITGPSHMTFASQVFDSEQTGIYITGLHNRLLPIRQTPTLSIYNHHMNDELICLGRSEDTGKMLSPVNRVYRTISESMRILAKQNHLYFRFTEQDMANEWLDEFFRIAALWLHSNQNDFNKAALNELCTLPIPTPNHTVTSVTSISMQAEINAFFHLPT